MCDTLPKSTADCNQPIFLAFGNPLLDISVILEPNDDILNKHNLKPNDEIEICEDKLKLILRDISVLPNKIHYVPGGSAQNTTRVLRWLLDVPNSTSYIGSVGKDEQGKVLEARNSADGVESRYIVQDGMSTGVCLAFINGQNRSLAAHLGAATNFTTEDFETCQNSFECLQNSKIIYVEGFFITDRVDVVENILDFCKRNNKLFCFNLNSEYIINAYGEQIKNLAIECDILFGNATQFAALGDLLRMDEEKTSLNIALFLNIISKNNSKITVVTDGAEPVICVFGRQVCIFKVPKISEECVVDTTGAGDSFVAGFMAGFIHNKDLKTCLAWGCWMSRQIIQMIGCQPPNISPSEIFSVTA